jgi:DNA-binding transcriptional LysR family regulator
MELGSMEAIKTSVMENHGISIVPYVTAKKELFTGTLKSKKIDGLNLKCDICLIYLKGHGYSKHIKEFINYMEQFGSETFC